MGGQTYVNKAKAFMEQSRKGVDFHKYQRDLDERDRQINTLNHQLEITKGEIASLRNAMMNINTMQAQVAQAGASMTRPVYPQPMMPSTQMYPQAAPGTIPTQYVAGETPMQTVPLPQAFDAQVQQINAGALQQVRRGRKPGSKNKPKTENPLTRGLTKLEPPSIG